MQAIAGTFGHLDEPIVKSMLDKIKHRGKDRMDVRVGDRTVVGAGIADAKTGERMKPIVEDDGLAVVSDSYILNKDDLQRTFLKTIERNMSDAELVLRLYRAIGTRLFEYLDGASAIAICDGDRLVLARDRYGIKPLYMSGGLNSGSFSSEMKSQILAHEEFAPFPPGKFMIQGEGYFSISWLPASAEETMSNVDPPTIIRDLLIASVQGCVRDSERTNVLLSGGIDSSVVAAAATAVCPNIRTACVGVEGSVDIDMARRVSSNLGTDHVERIFDADEMMKILDDVIYAAESYDFPLIRSCIPNYMATKLFGGDTKVTLCGEGGDELFAGYDYMREIGNDDELRAERIALLEACHNTGFQRVDRMTATWSLDGRVPLMSMRIVDLALSLDRSELIDQDGMNNKLVLRKAFARSLPPEVVWRRKQRFSDGAGSMYIMAMIADEVISDKEFEVEKAAAPPGRIRTKEEALYFRCFRHRFDSPSAFAAAGTTHRP